MKRDTLPVIPFIVPEVADAADAPPPKEKPDLKAQKRRLVHFLVELVITSSRPPKKNLQNK